MILVLSIAIVAVAVKETYGMSQVDYERATITVSAFILGIFMGAAIFSIDYLFSEKQDNNDNKRQKD